MATRASIEFDFRKAIEQAKKLEEVADSLSTLSNSKMQSTLQSISTNWKGENAAAYIAKGNTLSEQITDSAGDLLAIANRIRTVAERVYRAELEALAIAEMRLY